MAKHSSFQPLLPTLPSLSSHKSLQNTMLSPRTQHLDNDPTAQFDPFNSKNTNDNTWVQANFASNARKTAENYGNFNEWHDHDDHDQVHFRLPDSRVHSLPFWKSSPPESPTVHRPMSPASRTEAIVRGQRELMDMVKNMPESSYELTLKDLVEQTKIESSKEESLLLHERNQTLVNRTDSVGRGLPAYRDLSTSERLVSTCLVENTPGKPKNRVPNEKMDNKRAEKSKKIGESRRRSSGRIGNRGLILQMLFPVEIKPNKKKHVLNSSSAKISPKPVGNDRTSKNCDHKDWWRKRFSISSGSDGSRSSTHSRKTGSTSSRSTTRGKNGFFFTSCLPCFRYSVKSKSAE